MARINSGPVDCPRRAGFTIIELLASMTILVFIVMMMTRVFTETTNIWNLGTRRITTATEGRAVMDFMVNELTQAVADDVLSFKLSSGENVNDFGVQAYGADSDEIYFGAVVQSGTYLGMRNVNQFAYFIAPMLDEKEQPIPYRYRLARTRRTGSMYSSSLNRLNSIYKKDDWWDRMKPAAGYVEEAITSGAGMGQGCETIAENVSAFEVWAFSEATGDYEWDYSSRHNGNPAVADNKNMLPLWVDIYLEMLSEEDATKMAILWDIYIENPSAQNKQNALEFLSLNAKRFTTRVYFPNRERALAFNK